MRCGCGVIVVVCLAGACGEEAECNFGLPLGADTEIAKDSIDHVACYFYEGTCQTSDGHLVKESSDPLALTPCRAMFCSRDNACTPKWCCSRVSGESYGWSAPDSSYWCGVPAAKIGWSWSRCSP